MVGRVTPCAPTAGRGLPALPEKFRSKKSIDMKTCIKNLFLLDALIAGLGLIPAGRVMGQTFTTLHSFTGGSDGANPLAGLILSGTTLYGTAKYGGSLDNGTVFAVNTDGTGFTNLHSFTAFFYSYDTGSDTNSDGASPYAGLILSGNTLYGTAAYGGSLSQGTVFAVNTDGTGFRTLHSFAALSNSTNSDGAHPAAGLILSGTTLYGTAKYGGSLDYGTVFAVNTDGTDFTNLHSFTATSGSFTNSDGIYPQAGLILSGNTLYGTAAYGGSLSQGTVFAVNTHGTGFRTLHSFTALSNSTNSDGANPYAGLILSDNTLYGTASGGGSSGRGTVFAVNTDGTDFTNLHSFIGGSDGINPYAGLILSGNTLYGTAFNGGSSGAGTVFSLSLGSASAPQLTIIRSGANVILSWPTNAARFALQSTTDLVSPAVWNTVSPAPTVVNGQNVITNPVSGTRKFYRLSQ
jgi:uncharacterized repeat protein (TIGR03803 family)